jgi:hypothetical protein
MAATNIVDNFVAPSATDKPALGSDALGVLNNVLSWASKGVEIYQGATNKQADKIIANATADQAKVNPQGAGTTAQASNTRMTWLYGGVAAALVLLLVLVLKK